MLTKMGLMGIQLKIALKNEMPKEFEMIDSELGDKTTEVQLKHSEPAEVKKPLTRTNLKKRRERTMGRIS